MKFLQKYKLRKSIPRGQYCYSRHLGEHKCIYYTYVEDCSIKIPYCGYLDCGDISNIKDEDFYTLVKKYKSELIVCLIYPLDLLHDQVKCCGVKL